MAHHTRRSHGSSKPNFKKYLTQAISVGWGVMDAVQDRVDDTVSALEREGYLNRAEGRRLAKNLLTEANKWQKQFSQRVDKEVRKVTAQRSGSRAKKARR